MFNFVDICIYFFKLVYSNIMQNVLLIMGNVLLLGIPCPPFPLFWQWSIGHARDIAITRVGIWNYNSFVAPERQKYQCYIVLGYLVLPGYIYKSRALSIFLFLALQLACLLRFSCSGLDSLWFSRCYSTATSIIPHCDYTG